MALVIGTTVRITKDIDEKLNDRAVDAGSVGFINGVGQRSSSGKLYYVNVLDEKHFPEGVLVGNFAIPEGCIKPEPQKALRDARDSYLERVDELVEGYEERGRRYQEVLSYLSDMYSLGRDEIYAIYKAVLCFEDFYQNKIES